ncbi:LiaF transmembrane domain-containing protein [Bacillus massiliglaciei]|uniref:LiaF transmembrane domain-containing protein n=1 Tax=Bacillus massiliglaciei TaxID=1816693 RepID=UPI000ACDD689|nr:DUF5668 domain-containing protein [Bacillus massiliglaciei]
MKSQKIFSAVILIGFGLYFFLQHSHIEIFAGFYSWPTLLCITGLAFLLQAYKEKEHSSILPGIVLFGFGLHFHISGLFELWPGDIAAFMLILALGTILQARKLKASMLYGIIFIIIAVVALFYDRMKTGLPVDASVQEGLEQYWPIILVAVGAYLFIKKK